MGMKTGTRKTNLWNPTARMGGNAPIKDEVRWKNRSRSKAIISGTDYNNQSSEKMEKKKKKEEINKKEETILPSELEGNGQHNKVHSWSRMDQLKVYRGPSSEPATISNNGTMGRI